MAIRIITDSAADIIPAEAEKLGIKTIPLTLNWDGQDYRDAIDLDHVEFFNRLENSKSIPTTSQVSPDTFSKVFEEVTADGDIALVITLSSVLSGTWQSATIAAADYEGKVYVVDSLNATVGQRLLVQMALKYVQMDLPIETIVKNLEKDRGEICLIARLDTLEYLKKGGRISSAVAIAGEILNIKPVISVDQGAISLLGKARGSKKANNFLRKYVEEKGGVDFSRPFGLIYSGNSHTNLNEYIDDCADMWKDDVNELPISSIGPVIGTHVGPGAIGIAFFAKQE